MTNYANGSNFERKVGLALREEGYVVIRAAGSHGEADLVALKAGQVVLVQCKTDGYLSPKEWNAVYETANLVGAVPVLAHRPAPGRIEYWRLTARKESRGPKHYQIWFADEVGRD